MTKAYIRPISPRNLRINIIEQLATKKLGSEISKDIASKFVEHGYSASDLKHLLAHLKGERQVDAIARVSVKRALRLMEAA